MPAPTANHGPRPAFQGVVICGLPSSGNHLLLRLLGRHGLKAMVLHHSGDGVAGQVTFMANHAERLPRPLAALMPVRCPIAWAASAKPKHFAQGSDDLDGYRRTHYLAVMDFCFALGGIPLLPVSYEALVQHPQEVGEDTLRWLGVEPNGNIWGQETVVDANAKHWEVTA